MNPLRHCSSVRKTSLMGKQSRCQEEGPSAWLLGAQPRSLLCRLGLCVSDGEAATLQSHLTWTGLDGNRGSGGAGKTGGGGRGSNQAHCWKGSSPSLPPAKPWFPEVHQPLAMSSGRSSNGRVAMSPGLEVERVSGCWL